jgi:hypothetical protein
VDTDGQQYHLGKLHHLPLGSTTVRSTSGTTPAIANWTAAIQITGNYGVPVGAKAVRAKIGVFPYSTGAGIWELGEGISDNNSNTPGRNTAHPMIDVSGYASAAGQPNAYILQEMDIPLNASGQCYFFTAFATNVTLANCSYIIAVVGYYMGD